MGDEVALQIQQQYQQGNFSWFQARELHSRYLSCVESAAAICDDYVLNCSSGLQLERDDRADWCLRHPACVLITTTMPPHRVVAGGSQSIWLCMCACLVIM